MVNWMESLDKQLEFPV